MRIERLYLPLLACLMLTLWASCASNGLEGKLPGECSDGEDNDGDDAVDCMDSNCAGAPDCLDNGDDDDSDDDDSDDDDSDDGTTCPGSYVVDWIDTDADMTLIAHCEIIEGNLYIIDTGQRHDENRTHVDELSNLTSLGASIFGTMKA